MNQEATIEAQRLTGFLAACGYEPPDSADDVALDIVTPTRNRRVELVEQAKLIGPQLGANDRWIIVDDASDVSVDPRELIPYVAKEKLVIVYLTYARGEEGTINRARHLACSIARPDAWIVEVDDHDEAMIRAVNELYKVPTSELYEHVIVAATEISVKLVALLSKQSPPSETEASS